VARIAWRLPPFSRNRTRSRRFAPKGEFVVFR
jgi:hypothetical protein